MVKGPMNDDGLNHIRNKKENEEKLKAKEELRKRLLKAGPIAKKYIDERLSYLQAMGRKHPYSVNIFYCEELDHRYSREMGEQIYRALKPKYEKVGWILGFDYHPSSRGGGLGGSSASFNISFTTKESMETERKYREAEARRKEEEKKKKKWRKLFYSHSIIRFVKSSTCTIIEKI